MRRFFQPRSIGQRFAMAIGAAAGLILVVLAVANFLNGRELLLDQVSKEALGEIHNEIGNWDDLVERMAMLPSVIGATELSGKNRRGVTVPWLASLLEHTHIRAVYGLYMAREGLSWRDPLSDVWVDRKSWPQAAHLRYDFHDPGQDWYRGAKEKNGIHVTLPYFDEGGSDIAMISITKAVHDPSGKFLGVAGCDVSLEEMEKVVGEMHLRDFGRNLFPQVPDSGDSGTVSREPGRQVAYLVSCTGDVLIGPAQQSGGGNPEKLGRSLGDYGLILGPDQLREILNRSSGWLRTGKHGNTMLCWAESRTTGWKLLLSVPYSLILSPARNLAFQSLLIGGAGLILLLGIVFYVAGKVAGPIRALQKVTENFKSGFYGQGGEILSLIRRRTDELGRFADGFSAMAGEIRLREQRLSEWNSNLEKTVAKRTADLADAVKRVERANGIMAAELAEAAAYSRATLPPKLTAPVATDWEFAPSSQLGGDSFGYHWIDGDHLALYLLDVCGHGVGAALLSVSMVSVLRNCSLPETDFRDPSSVLAGLNAAFPMERHNDMFCTAWYGVYSLSGKRLRYACGGHPPAVLITAEGVSRSLPSRGPALGTFPGSRYETSLAEIPPGSRLYLFSDGAYEVSRPGLPMMDYDGFRDLLATAGEGSSPRTILETVRARHGGGPFEDDFSLVEFRFPETPHHSISSISVTSRIEELERVRAFTEGFADLHGLDSVDRNDLHLILEEVVTNVIKYAGLETLEERSLAEQNEACTIALCLGGGGDLLEITFTDQGVPFDPLAREAVQTSGSAAERPIGGLGIHFLKNLTDFQHYEHRDGKNILTLKKKLRRSEKTTGG